MYISLSIVIAAFFALSWSQNQPGVSALTKRTVVAPGIELRVLPLGDSITDGFKSTGNNGYRIGLQQDLAGSKLLYVGDRTAGTIANNENAGYSGFTISEIASAASHAISSDNPNIVLLHAGTNDLNLSPPPDNEPYSGAPERLGSLIDQCIKGSANAVILVAQIINSGDPGTESRIQTFNDAIPGIVAQRANAGHHVMTVDMRSVTTKYLADDLHPNDAGYKMMADLWFAGLQAADAKGWIKPPVGNDPIPGSTAACSSGQKQKCLSNPVWYNPDGDNPIASGVGHGGDGKFANNWIHYEKAASGIGQNGTGVRLADINGDGRADYLWLNETNGAVIAYLNTGTGNTMSWDPLNDGKPIASGVGPGAGVRFADISGSGKVDYLFVGDGGAVQLYQNGGPDGKGGWDWIGPKQIASGVPGAKQNNVFFPDINGDGRADYAVVGEKGEVSLWLNIGEYKSYDITWVPQDQIASGLGTPNISLVDISGDGRADYMIWDQLGGLTGYLNVRGPKETPIWVDQGGSKSIAGGVGVDWTLCRLADLNGDGKADYTIIDVKNGALDLYINNGHADTSVTGDGIWLIDMNNDGLDDYVFMDTDGSLILYTNGGPGNNGWVWISQGTPQANSPIATGVGAKREQVRLAYIFGHGRADYVVVDDVTGAISVWENGGPDKSAPGGWLWIQHGQLASGLGAGEGVRFADINGDGRDDYIWLSPSGAATIYINEVGTIPENWVALNDGKPVATGVGALREDVRFADIDGDGRADYCWVHPVDGSVNVWYNLAVNTASSINWVQNPNTIASGVGYAGANVKFAFLNHPRTGRADYVAVEPSNGALHVWLSDCNDLAPAGSDNTSNGDCETNPTASVIGSSGVSSPTSTQTPASSSQPGTSSPPNTSQPSIPSSGAANTISPGGAPTTTVVETAIPGLTVSGVVTIGNPTLVPGAMPTGSGITSLQPIASQVAQLYASAQSAIANLASEASPSSDDVSSAEQALARVYQALQLLTAVAQALNPQSLSSQDAQLLQNLQGQLPKLLSQLASAISQLGPSTRGTPDTSAIQQVADLIGPNGTIEQAIDSIVQPVASLPGPSSPGGNGDEITISGYTTIPKNTLSPLPTSGPAAISALKPAASQLSSAVDAAGRASSNSNPSSGDVSGLASLLSGLVGDASSLASGLDGIELSDFSTGEVPQIIEAQNGARNLLDLSLDALNDVVSGLNKPNSWLNIFRRNHPRLVAGGNIFTAASLVTGIVLGFHESPSPTSKSATATSSTSSSTATPSSWLMNTIPGTTVSDFESFIKTLPDGGSGRQIVYGTADHQWYVGEMTLDEARAVSKHPIIDQIVSNDPAPITSAVSSKNTKNYQKRAPQPVTLDERIKSPRHLRLLSMPMSSSIASLPESALDGNDDPSTRYTFEAKQGEDVFIYILDYAFDNLNEEFLHNNGLFQTHSVQGVRSAASDANPDDNGHGTEMASHAAGDRLGVASRAKLIGVKFLDQPNVVMPERLADAWEWIMEDVRTHQRKGKAVLLFAYETRYTLWIDNNAHVDFSYEGLPVEDYTDYFLPLLFHAWSTSIVTVFPCGNDPSKTMGDSSPQRFATAQNAVIITGAVDHNGNPWYKNTPPGPARDGGSQLPGNIDVYGLGVDVLFAKAGADTYVQLSGSSGTAAQAAGLAAYVLTAPSESQLDGRLPVLVKRRIVALSRILNSGGVKIMYNGVREIFCATTSSAKVRAREAHRHPFAPNEADLVRRQAVADPFTQSIYDNGLWANLSDAQFFTCKSPDIVSGFLISQYLAASQSEPGVTQSFYAYQAGRLGRCASHKAGLQLNEQGWVTGPDDIKQITNGTTGSSFTMSKWTQGVEPSQQQPICGTASSITFTKTDESTYDFKDNNGAAGTCYVDPNGHALASYICDYDNGDTYDQVVLLSCIGSDANYCDAA